MTDSLLNLLADLPRATLDERRSARVQARCHDVLARHRQSAEHGVVRRWWEPVVVGLGGLYLAGVIRETLLLYGVL